MNALTKTALAQTAMAQPKPATDDAEAGEPPLVLSTFEELIFLAEAFTRPKRMATLAKLGFTQSYTYYTWKNTRWEIEEYLSELSSDLAPFLRPNFFANTPDILHAYLQYGGRGAFAIRATLAATLSPSSSMTSGAAVLKVSSAGRMTPTDLRVPSAKVTVWLTHLPSK